MPIAYVLTWADEALHVRVLGVYATRRRAEEAAQMEAGAVRLEWRPYVNDTPPAWFANGPRAALSAQSSVAFYLIAERELP
jgi:hypothetical protein